MTVELFLPTNNYIADHGGLQNPFIMMKSDHFSDEIPDNNYRESKLFSIQNKKTGKTVEI